MMDKENKADDINLRMRRAINRTYQTIGYDAFGDTDPSLATIVEITLDADYMEMYGGDREAVKAFRKLDYAAQDKLAEKALGW